ncbi:DUF6671 family protein [Flavobacterium polysaccharolyticum]|uniref:DUF6671 family protein n=1 Tax=Flavobacterium polysaccharolyticum TaxID=3133148 RepID=A0ABU9NTS9_9FLAO
MSWTTLNSFKGRQLVIATMHHKEQVMAPILEKGLGVICTTPKDFDTDIFGTFSGEITRVSDALTVARQKCLAAIVATDCDLAVASEGSFGPHPSAYFATADDELVVLIDRLHNLEIIGRAVSFKTNFAGKVVECEKDLLDFASQVDFPTHGLILRSSQESTEGMVKGILSEKVLLESFHAIQSNYHSVFVETDMRALYNPTRMEIISMATKQLVQNVQSLCPECQTPGFTITDVKTGLPCSWCGSATSSVLSHIYSCKKCCYTQEDWYPKHKKTEDPGFCNYCNP